ncbi:MAG: hypothetical protein RLZ94_2639, partial [Actinomycetota bacterium]
RKRHRAEMHRRRGTTETAATLFAHFGGSVFTLAEAEKAGVSARRLGLATEAGFVLRLRRGLYRVADAHMIGDARTVDPGVAQMEIAGHLVGEFRERGVDAAMGDETAAYAWGLPHTGLTVPTIRVPRGSTTRRGTRHGVRVREGDTDDVVTFRGQFITSPLATARDICRELPRHQAVGLFGLAQRRLAEWLIAGDERMDPGDLTSALTDADLRAQLGAEMRRMLADSTRRQHWCDSADPRPETYLEGISWGRLTSWRLGDMAPQAWVRGASGRSYRVDVLIDGVAGEADGAVKYATRDALWKEKLRQEDIENGGTPVVRWTFAEAEHRPHVLLARWRNALGRLAA